MFKDRIAQFLWKQFRQPSGWLGRLIGNRMAEGNVHDAQWTISLLDIHPEQHILEIGFGPGVSTYLAGEQATQGFVAGIDYSETMVQAARKRNLETIQAGRMELKHGDVASLPYPDETFDKAFSLHSIYFWGKPIECLQELRRVLKPGGLLAITILPKDKWNELQQRETSLRTLYFSADLVAMFSAAGFREVRVEVSPKPSRVSRECILGIK